MTHDPLCAWWSIQCDSECAELPYGSSCKHMFCVCDLIAKVEARTEDCQCGIIEGTRQDERKRRKEGPPCSSPCCSRPSSGAAWSWSSPSATPSVTLTISTTSGSTRTTTGNPGRWHNNVRIIGK